MKKFNIFLVIFLSVFNLAIGQDKNQTLKHKVIRCYTPEAEKQHIYHNSKARRTNTTQSFEKWIKPLVETEGNKKYRKADEKFVIPVVVHVIHNGSPLNTPNKVNGENISDKQVFSQIKVLNEDYRRLAGSHGAESTGYKRGVDTEIEFKLASIAPDGTATNGIDRVSLNKESWNIDETEDLLKPATIWDPSKYLNIWVVNLIEDGSEILGYAQFPVQSGLKGLEGQGNIANTDGVVIRYDVFGSKDEDDKSFNLKEDYDLGRTTTHEVGHWLGLRHIWGDADDDEDGCSVDDFCVDTPNASEPNYDCRTPKRSCDSVDMVENYMDYTNDACMNTFTQDQKNRMYAVLNNSPRRKELKNANVFTTSIYSKDTKIQLASGINTNETMPCSPNQGITPVLVLTNNGVDPITSVNIEYGIEGKSTKTYNWTGSLEQFKYEEITLPTLTDYSEGNNKVIAKITAIDGGIDDFVNNNTDFRNYSFNAPKNYSGRKVSLEIRPDDYGSEISWDLKDANGDIIYEGGPYVDYDTTLIKETFNLEDGCYVFTIYDEFGDGLYDGGGYKLIAENGTEIASGASYGSGESTPFTLGALATNEINDSSSSFRIYPNPSNGTFNIDYNFTEPVFTVNVYDMSGRKIYGKNTSSKTINLNRPQPGIYIVEIRDGNKAITEKIIIK